MIETGWDSDGYQEDGFMVDDFELTGETNDFSLPVELTNFNVSAIPGHKAVKLSWRTESEVNNAYWLIQRKNEGLQFSEIDKIPGQGSKSNATNYEYIDSSVKPNNTYTYRLIDVAYDGSSEIHSEQSIFVAALPEKFTLHPNYPNPFNPSTTIKFELPAGKSIYKTDINIYNVLGQKVRDLLTAELETGRYTEVWDGRNNFGSSLPSGTYYLVIKAGEYTDSMKMLYLK